MGIKIVGGLRRQGDVLMFRIEGEVESSSDFLELTAVPKDTINGERVTIVERGEGSHHFHVVDEKVKVIQAKVSPKVFKRTGMPSFLNKVLILEATKDTTLRQVSTAAPGTEVEALHTPIPLEEGQWLVFPQQVEYINAQPRPVTD